MSSTRHAAVLSGLEHAAQVCQQFLEKSGMMAQVFLET